MRLFGENEANVQSEKYTPLIVTLNLRAPLIEIEKIEKSGGQFRKIHIVCRDIRVDLAFVVCTPLGRFWDR